MASKVDMYELIPELNWIKDSSTREKCAAVWLELIEEGGWNEKGLDKTLVDTSICYEDLVTHTRRVTQSVKAFYDSLKGNLADDVGPCDEDVLIAGSILHDVAKLIELDIDPKDGTPFTTDRGYMFKHSTSGAYYAKKHGLCDEIVHAILAHSPFISPPNALESPESLIIRTIDDLRFRYLALHKRPQAIKAITKKDFYVKK